MGWGDIADGMAGEREPAVSKVATAMGDMRELHELACEACEAVDLVADALLKARRIKTALRAEMDRMGVKKLTMGDRSAIMIKTTKGGKEFTKKAVMHILGKKKGVEFWNMIPHRPATTRLTIPKRHDPEAEE